MMLVYLAGPLSAVNGISEQDNAEAAVRVYIQLVRAGIPSFCPHLSFYCQERSMLTYEDWLWFDFGIIDVCTHVLMLPRWQDSKGAVREHQYALDKGKVILYELEGLIPS